MEWFLLAIIGAVIGTVISFFTQRLHLPQPLAVLVATVGALAGGGLAHVAGFAAFGRWTFYITGAGLALGVLAGAILAFSLTSEEKRI